MKFAVVIAMLALAGVAAAMPNLGAMFSEWQLSHGRNYASQEEHDRRFSIFVENYRLAAQLTHDEGPDGALYDVSGPFADLTTEEFAAQYLSGFVPPAPSRTLMAPASSEVLAGSFDWSDKGAVTSVKNQGSCGSCWAFSTVGGVEGLYQIAGNELTDISPQFLVDCDTTVDKGCQGGLMDEAYKYIKSVGGIMTEKDYPYKGRNGDCQKDDSKLVAAVDSYYKVSEDENEIAQVLQDEAPLPVGLNAMWLQFYRKGVSNPKLCNPKGLNHGVLIVGFGEDGKKGTPFWRVKNSWGERWGESGFFRMIRGKGRCGINTYVIGAKLKESEPMLGGN